MRVLLLSLLSFLLIVQIKAQNGYELAIKQGDVALINKNFELAINKYFAAEAFAPENKIEIQQKINQVFEEINKLRVIAKLQSQDLKKANDSIRNAKKNELDALEKLLQETKEKNEAEKRADREKERRIQSYVQVFAAEAKDELEIEKARQFFGEAYNFHDEGKDTSLQSDHSLLEAGNMCLHSNQNIDTITQQYPYANINDWVFDLKSSEIYLTGGGNRNLRVQLAPFSKVQPPKVQKIEQVQAWSNTTKNNCIALDLDNKWLAIGGENGQLSLFQNDSFCLELSKALAPNAYILDLQFHADQELVVICDDSTLYIFDLKEKKLKSKNKLKGLPFKICKMPQQKTFLVATDQAVYYYKNGKTSLWEDMSLGNSQAPSYILECSWGADHQQLYIATTDNQLLVYEHSDAHKFKFKENHNLAEDITAMHYASNGYLMIGYQSGVIELWPAKNLDDLSVSPIRLKHPAAIVQIGYYPPKNQLIVSGQSYFCFYPLDYHAIYQEFIARYTEKALKLPDNILKQFTHRQ